MRCHSLPSTVAIKRRQKRVYGEKFLFLVHSIHVSGWSTALGSSGIVTPPRSMMALKVSVHECEVSCFDFNCLKPIVRTVFSSASPNSIPAVQASAASSSCRAHPKKIINSSVTLHVSAVTFTYYHLQNLVGVKNKSACRTIPDPF